jgi:hypothetical protein
MDKSKDEASLRMGQTKIDDIKDSVTEKKLDRLTSNNAKEIINKSGTENRTDTFSDKESLDNKDKALMFGTSGVMLNEAGLKSEINTFVSKHQDGIDNVEFTGDTTDRMRGDSDKIIEETAEKVIEETEKIAEELKELAEEELIKAKELLEEKILEEERAVQGEIDDVIAGRKTLNQVSAAAMKKLSG